MLGIGIGISPIFGGTTESIVAGRINAFNGGFAFAGQDVTLRRTNILVAGNGGFSFAGQDATLTRSGAPGSVISTDSGTFNFAGDTMELLLDRFISAESGGFSFAGQDATLRRTHILAAGNGGFTFAGQDATLTQAGSGNAFTLIANAGGAGTPDATTSAIDTTGADLLVVAVSYYSGGFAGGGATATVQDSKGNTWTGLTGRQGNVSANRIWYCRGGTVGSGHTFTVLGSTGSGAGAASIAVQAWSGSNATPFDVQNGALVTSTTSVQAGSVTPSQNNSLIIAAASITDNSSAYNVNSGFTITNSVPWQSGTNEGVSLAYLKQNAAAAVNPTFSWTGTADAAANNAVFKP